MNKTPLNLLSNLQAFKLLSGNGFFSIYMSFENFQLLDNEPGDNSIFERDYLKIYHQQGAQLNQNNQNIEFIFVENNSYHQISNAYIELDITV